MHILLALRRSLPSGHQRSGRPRRTALVGQASAQTHRLRARLVDPTEHFVRRCEEHVQRASDCAPTRREQLARRTDDSRPKSDDSSARVELMHEEHPSKSMRGGKYMPCHVFATFSYSSANMYVGRRQEHQLDRGRGTGLRRERDLAHGAMQK